MVQAGHDAHAQRRTRALTEAIDPVAAELRLVEVADFITFIRCHQYANIQDIVDSSIELFFVPGALSFAGAADFDVDWDRAPTIILGMEFRCLEVWIVFKMFIRAADTRVAIELLSFTKSSGSPDRDTARLIEVIEKAKLPLPHGPR